MPGPSAAVQRSARSEAGELLAAPPRPLPATALAVSMTSAWGRRRNPGRCNAPVRRPPLDARGTRPYLGTMATRLVRLGLALGLVLAAAAGQAACGGSKGDVAIATGAGGAGG